MGLEQNRDAGIYCRLSVDDERTGESVSIENQKLLLQKYVKDQGWNEVEVYCDDGYSGTNFDRPAVQRMIEDAKSGRINIIVVKDLSRFGRNYIEIGQFTDYLFPQIGCRFIALGNGIDTLSQSSNNDMMGFLNLFNEFYARDTSKKVRAVRKACAENGKFMGTYAPLGYRKDPQDKHRLIIDEEIAPLTNVSCALLLLLTNVTVGSTVTGYTVSGWVVRLHFPLELNPQFQPTRRMCMRMKKG